MSDTDSFIDEVTEEVRRDRLYGYLRRYGWIGIVVVVLIVAGATWSEYRKAQTEAEAEALGDAIIAAMSREDAADRAAAVAEITAESPGSRAWRRAISLNRASPPATRIRSTSSWGRSASPATVMSR